MYRCAVYIDGGYLRRILQTKNQKLDFEKLIDILIGKDELLRTYYYICLPFKSDPPTKDEQKTYDNMERFIDHLKIVPRFEVKLGRLQKLETNQGRPRYRQKGVDTMLSVDLAKMSWDKQIQKAIIITADSDFVYAIKSAKDAGVITHLWYYGGKGRWNVNRTIIEEADNYTEITDDILEKCKINP